MKTKYYTAPVTQSGDQAQNNPIRPRWFAQALGGLLFTSVFALLSSSAQAGCSQYDVSGQWTITQGSYLIHVVLSQNGKTISGTAQQNWVSDHQVKELHGQLTGTIAGAMFYVQINWNNGQAGVYSGEIAKGGGGLYGTAYDKNDLQSTARWSSDHHFNCADAAPATPKPITHSGKAKSAPDATKSTSAAADDWINQELRKRKTTTQPSEAPAPTRKAPFIVADYKPEKPGTMTLTWDGGPEHPYAEVWVTVNDQDEKFVVEKGKGTRVVTAEQGKTYLYILTDSGKTLATVTVD